MNPAGRTLVLREVDDVHSFLHSRRGDEQTFTGVGKDRATDRLGEALSSLLLYFAPVFFSQFLPCEAELLGNARCAQIENPSQGELDRHQQPRSAKGHRHIGVVGCSARFGYCNCIFRTSINGTKRIDRVPAPPVKKASLPEQNALWGRVIQRRDSICRPAPWLEQLRFLPQPLAHELEANMTRNLH